MKVSEVVSMDLDERCGENRSRSEGGSETVVVAWALALTVGRHESSFSLDTLQKGSTQGAPVQATVAALNEELPGTSTSVVSPVIVLE